MVDGSGVAFATGEIVNLGVVVLPLILGEVTIVEQNHILQAGVERVSVLVATKVGPTMVIQEVGVFVEENVELMVMTFYVEVAITKGDGVGIETSS